MKIQIGKDISIEASAELVVKIHSIFRILKDVKKVDVDYDKYLIRIWTVDHGAGRPAMNIQIQEKT